MQLEVVRELMARLRIHDDVFRVRILLRQEVVAQDVDGNGRLELTVAFARSERVEVQVHVRPVKERPLLHVQVVDDLHLDVNARAVIENAEHIEATEFLRLPQRRKLHVPILQIDECRVAFTAEHVIDERERHILALRPAEDEFEYEIIRRVVVSPYGHIASLLCCFYYISSG